MASNLKILTSGDAAAVAAQWLEHMTANALAQGDTLLLLSGGSAADAYRLLAQTMTLGKQPRGRLLVGLIDERHGLPGHPDSNEQLIRSTGLIDRLEQLGATWLPVLTGGQPADEAREYQRKLQEYAKTARVVALLGMGADGHTAGMLPDTDAAMFDQRFDAGDWVTAYPSPDHGTRITLTMTALRQIKGAVVYATGEAKRPVIEKIMNPETPLQLNQTPAGIWRELPHVLIVTTKEALL